MKCWRCNAEMENTEVKCPQCGAARAKVRRQQAAEGAASAYHERMQAAETDASAQAWLEKRRTQQETPAPPRRRPPTTVSTAAPPPEEPRRRRASRPPQPVAQQEEPRQQAIKRPAPSQPPQKRQPQRAPGGGSMGRQPVMQAAAGAGAAVAAQQRPRMVRRHEYEAIVPDTRGYDHVNWLRLCLIAVICVVLLVAGIFMFLKQTGPGQRLLAANGMEASRDAYHELGRMYLSEGSVTRAVWALEIAQTKDEDNGVELLIDLGRAYKGNGQLDRAELAYSRAIEFWPAYPEAYRLLVDIYLEQGRNFEAVKLLEIASEKTNGDSYFQSMLVKLMPAAPTASLKAERYDEEQEVTLSGPEGGTIYYSKTGGDPITEGVVYNTGDIIYLEEGAWRLIAVVEKDGMYSKELINTYTIKKAEPDMPKSSLPPKAYDSVKSITLSAGSDVVAIYYTVDGKTPTVETGKLYDKEKPIKLGVGYTTVKAIAVNSEGKTSPIMSYTYKCDGRVKNSMDESDTVAGLKLHATTQSDFIDKYGQPMAEEYAGDDLLGTYTKLTYSFGYATFLDKGNDKEPVLAELWTNSSSFSGPRSTGIGTRKDDVIDAFRDLGGEEDKGGNRILYTLDNNRMAQLVKLGEGQYTISYYCQRENKHFIELTYHIENDLVVAMEWAQFEVAK